MAVVTKSATQSVGGKGTAFEVPAISNPRLTGMVLITGSPTYTVEYSLNGEDYLALSTALTSQVTSKDFTIVFPIKDVRIDFVSGSGTVKLIVRADFGGFA